MARTYQRRELRLLGEWLAATYPNAIISNNVRLGDYPIHLAGALPAGMSKKALSGYRRYVDAVVKLPEKVLLVEAKITLDVDAAASLELYKELWPDTPEYDAWTKLPVELVIVAAIIDPVVKRLAEQKGVTVIQYSPPWLSVSDVASDANVRKLDRTPLNPLGG